MPINPNEFQQSITKEINTIKNRVRNLIGNANWGEEGRYKEAVLKNVIKKFIPSNLSVGTGFVLQGNELDYNQAEVSSQLDIIIYDNTYPVLFSEGDFIITTEANVRAIIEVKTKVVNTNGQSNSLRGVIEKFNLLSVFPRISCTNNNRIFKGLFSYDYTDDIENARVEEILRLSNGMINHISLGKDKFIRHWTSNVGLTPPVECNSHFYNIYQLNDLSFSYFISNLIHMVSTHSLNDRGWFSFPIPGTKEQRRVRTVCFENRT